MWEYTITIVADEWSGIKINAGLCIWRYNLMRRNTAPTSIFEAT